MSEKFSSHNSFLYHGKSCLISTVEYGDNHKLIREQINDRSNKDRLEFEKDDPIYWECLFLSKNAAPKKSHPLE